MSSLYFNMIASGSRGNCSILYNETEAAVIDCGISYKRFLERYSSLTSDKAQMSLLISHEHSDHSSGISLLKKRTGIDIYSRRGTLRALGLEMAYPIADEVAIGGMLFHPVDVSHDATEPVAFVVSSGKAKISVISDLGFVNQDLIESASGSDILAIEANHDIDMLRNGTYSGNLKARIESNHGHLSNFQCADAIARMCKPATRIVLTHLSQQNNTEEKALESVTEYLKQNRIQFRSIECATQEKGSSIFSIDTKTGATAKHSL